MTKVPKPIAVITADIVGSSSYSPKDRRAVDRILHAAFRETERRFPKSIHTGMAFRVTAGDEFQCVIADTPQVLQILTYLRAVAATGGLDPPVRFRASIGIGTLSTAKRPNPYEEDGVAFVRARRGLERLDHRRGPTRWTMLITGNEDVDVAADAVLSLADYVMEGWTVAQWGAVRWALLGFKRKEIARKPEDCSSKCDETHSRGRMAPRRLGIRILTRAHHQCCQHPKRGANKDSTVLRMRA
jgi:hypothetical protein